MNLLKHDLFGKMNKLFHFFWNGVLFDVSQSLPFWVVVVRRLGQLFSPSLIFFSD